MKRFVLIIFGVMWCSYSFSEIYIFKAQYINKLQEIELDYNYCLKTKNKIACNRVIEEHQKIKSNLKFQKFFSSDRCDIKCKRIIFKLNQKEAHAIAAAQGLDLNDLLKSLPKD